jgi:hypothetical protein
MTSVRKEKEDLELGLSLFASRGEKYELYTLIPSRVSSELSLVVQK